MSRQPRRQSLEMLWVLVVSVFLLVSVTAGAAERSANLSQNAGGIPVAPVAPVAVDNDMDGFFTPADCNDNNDEIFPGAPEKCNGLDDDCDGMGDEPFPELGDPCTVGIGECETAGTLQCLMDGSGTACDAVAGTPVAELCDGLDNDCNGLDDAGNPGVGGQESDGDGDTQWECQGDCDDADPDNYSGNLEVCDGQDNDCAASFGTSSLATNGWFSDDTRADGAGLIAHGTNLRSDTLTDDPEGSALGTPAHDADITRQIEFVTAPGTVPLGTHPYAVHLSIVPGAGSGKSQISHRKDDGVGHAAGSVFGPGFLAEYSWMANGTVSVTPSLKFGIKTSEFATTGVSTRTGENVWDKVLIYEPGNQVPDPSDTADGLWHTETVTHTSGRWWFFDRKAGAGTIGTPMTLASMATSPVLVGGGPKTIADVYALITAPGAHITSVQFGIGSGNAGGNVYVNQLETNFYRVGDVTTFGGRLSGADFPGETTDADGDMSLACLDCDDMDPDNFPGNMEVCDGFDNDCDLMVPATEIDDDGDLQAECQGDCDDMNAARFLGNPEICDALDNDCDLIVPPTEIDDDGDMQAECQGDCDDTNDAIYLGNLELCGDGFDNDCDTFIDGGDRYVATTGSDASNDCTASGTPCATIQHAVDVACDGDTVNVDSGTFAGAVDIDRPVTISCANAGIPWNGVRGPETVINGSAVPAAIDISASDVTIDGCEVVGGASTYVGVQLFNGSTNILDVTIANNLIHGMRLANPFAAFSDLAYGVFSVTGAPGARHEVRGLSITGNHAYDIGVFGVCGGVGAYLNHVIGASPGDGVTVTGNRFRDMKSGPGAFDLGTGLVVDAGADNGAGTPTAPSSGALVAGNLYEDVVGGAVMFTDDSTFDEAHASFTDVTYFMLNINNLGTLATVDELALAPYARTDDPLSAAFVPGSHLYSPTVQTAVNFSDPLATIDVTAGTFTEQVDVPKSVQIIGAGEALTTIQAPATLVNDAVFGQKTIMAIHGAGVSTELTGVTVAGPGPSPCGSIHYGVLVYGGAHANIHDNTVADVRDNVLPISGCQNGIAIRVGSQLLASIGTADLDDNTLTGYQKGGVVIDGTGSSADITGNDVTGAGATPNTAQNGLQFSRGATGTASTNAITGHLCDAGTCGPAGFQAIGVLLFDAGAGVTLTDNVIDDNDLGVYNFAQGLTTLTSNDVTTNRYVGLFLEEGQAQVEDNLIDAGSQTAVWLYAFSGVAADSSATLLRNTITNAENGVLLGDDDTGDAHDPLLEAHFNHIFGHTTLGMDNQGAAVTADATCNWWGAADGPGPVGPGSGDGISTDVDATTWLLFADFGADNDGDMFTSCTSDAGGDCDVATATVYPGAPQVCDGLNNDCADPFWPSIAEGTGAANEADGDGDLQSECGGDCNDVDGTVYVGATETCDTVDNDCDTVLNNGAADADCDSGIVCQFDTCSSLGACEYVASGACGVAGNVYYYDVVALMDEADLAKPVEDVSVEATGETSDVTLTDGTGLYDISNAVGNTVVTPSRDADANDLASLSSQDAALIAQRAVSLVVFSTLQFECGDVSNNNTITSFDASLVAQKVVNPLVLLPAAVAAGQDWTFVPSARSYTPVTADEVGEDYIGCVYGDVTNSWAPAGGPSSIAPELPVPSDDAQSGGLAAIAASGQGSIDASEGQAMPSYSRSTPAVLYLAGTPELNDDGSWTYTFGLQEADGIVAVDLELVHKPSQVELVEVRTVGIATDLTAIAHARAEEGRIGVAVFGATALEGTGSFLEVTVHVDGASSGLPFRIHAQANEQMIPLRWGIDLEPADRLDEAVPDQPTAGQSVGLESK